MTASHRHAPDKRFDERLTSALAHHRSGQLDEAEKKYRAALALRPANADALHYLGVLTHQRGDHEKALDLIGRALNVRPDVPQMLCNLAEVQRAMGRPQEAEASSRRALKLCPEYPEASLNLAVALFQQKRFADAEEAAHSALRLRPDFVGAHAALADALREQGRLREAEESYRRVLALAPDHDTAMANLGLMLLHIGRMEDGLELCRRAASRTSGEILPLQNLARMLLEYGRLDEAMQILEQALERSPNVAEISLLIGIAWDELGEIAEAANWLDRALRLDGDLLEARVRLAGLEADVENHQEALDILESVLQIDPARLDAIMGKARARLALGDVDVQENNKPDALGGLAGFHCSQVMLVTHSMGGLVARACAKLPGAEELIAGTLLGVMPTNGAAVAYRRCKVGMRDESYLASQVIGQSGQEVTAVFAQAPGALALLPTANYQPGWLEIAGPQFKRTLPEKDPYAEIYGTKNPWWTLVSEAWLSPEGSKNPLTWTDFKEFLDLAAKFHANLTPTDYHPNTIAYYGGALNNEDVVGRSRDLGKHPSFERVVWQMRQGTSPTGERTAPPPNPQQVFEAGHQDLRADGVKPEYVGGAVEWTYSGRTDNVVRQETSDWELWPSSQDSSGDGTVPASSGNAPVQCDKVRQVFRVAGIEHEGAYQNKTVQGLTFYALTKLLVRSKAFESRTNASCKA